MSIAQSRPEDVVKMALDKCQSRSAMLVDSYDNYVLRVSGRDEYFLGDYPLSQFKVCIQHAVLICCYFLMLLVMLLTLNVRSLRLLFDSISVLFSLLRPTFFVLFVRN